MVCNKTEKRGEIWLERFTEMSGDYKPLTYSGTEEVLAASGTNTYYSLTKGLFVLKLD